MKRFNIGDEDNDCMIKSPKGKYVRFEDAEAEINRRKAELVEANNLMAEGSQKIHELREERDELKKKFAAETLIRDQAVKEMMVQTEIRVAAEEQCKEAMRLRLPSERDVALREEIKLSAAQARIAELEYENSCQFGKSLDIAKMYDEAKAENSRLTRELEIARTVSPRIIEKPDPITGDMHSEEVQP